jgi:hypothetical protein
MVVGKGFERSVRSSLAAESQQIMRTSRNRSASAKKATMTDAEFSQAGRQNKYIPQTPFSPSPSVLLELRRRIELGFGAGA